MSPDFKPKTIETIAKRAAYLCSNPDCRTMTVGPNSETDKATTIGEAAHICGARPDTARYKDTMSDVARGEITNAIWLCRNCHRKVDRDESAYSAELLFAWREEHDRFVAAKLGDRSDLMRSNLEASHLDQFRNYPPLIRRIIIDKPNGWEWRLTAELMRHLNGPILRKLGDLREGLYTRPIEHVSDDDAVSWVVSRVNEMGTLVPPLVKLIDRLNSSWGKPGEPGDLDQIHHVSCLLRDGLEQIAQFEERLKFARVPDTFEKIKELMQSCLGAQVQKFDALPDILDEAVALIGTNHGGTRENPHIIHHTITFELPPDWEQDMHREIRRIKRTLSP